MRKRRNRRREMEKERVIAPAIFFIELHETLLVTDGCVLMNSIFRN